VKSFSFKVRGKWLRLALAVLLPLHAGFAQAAMVLPVEAVGVAAEAVQQMSVGDAALMSDGMPCHQLAKASPVPDHSSQHEDGCCKTGSCHCVAACGLPFTIARIAPQPGLIVSPFRNLSVPAGSPPPDLRPPIG
jgi:hypothetical protein